MVNGLFDGLQSRASRSSQILEATYRLSQRTWDICALSAVDTQRMRSGTAASDPVAVQGGNVLRLESAVAGPKFTALISESGSNPVRSDFGGSDGERVLHFTDDTLHQNTASNLATTSLYGFAIFGATRTTGTPRVLRMFDTTGATEQIALQMPSTGVIDFWSTAVAVTGLTMPSTEQLFVMEFGIRPGENRVTTHFAGGTDSRTGGGVYSDNIAQLRLGANAPSTSMSPNLRFRALFLSSTRPTDAAVLAENLAWAKILANVP